MPKGRGPEGEIPLSKARRPRTPCRPSLILTSTRSLRSSRPAVTVATDDTQWFGRFARLLDGAWPGRRPQGLRYAHRQTPAPALDPATQAQRVAVMPYCARRVRRRRSVISTLRTGCHFYVAPTWHGMADTPNRRHKRGNSVHRNGHPDVPPASPYGAAGDPSTSAPCGA
jgi:hypothetical protein